ncbi:MAG: hypothetical protein A3E79_17420 [Burkholderiales bacterium RIFCSPHIGHO2_12_FULL_61_11]|nr:MAG: hypothetical protein A3E79_17420 [Burkholderiales bacterium RIFCSPHIGHO2_12_FULL_61_11]
MGATLRRQGVLEAVESAPGEGVLGTGTKAGMTLFSQKEHTPTISPKIALPDRQARRAGNMSTFNR